MKILRILLAVLCVSLFGSIYSQDSRIQKPIEVFDELWNVYNDHYANFELKGVDWDNIYRKYRPLINEQTTNDSLFSVCEQMLLELKDGHVGLYAYKNDSTLYREITLPYSTRILDLYPDNRDAEPNIYQIIYLKDSTLLKNGFKPLRKTKYHLMAYSTSADLGYLSIRQMDGLMPGEVDSFLDEATKAFVDKKGIIIDIRYNGGGDDLVSYKIANRFTDKKRVGHYKRERIAGTESYTDFEPWYLEPEGNIQFTKPIVLLTSDFTASAADVFALALSELPHVSIVGDNTEGIFSDVKAIYLSNGWEVSLSHQQYVSSEKVNYEGEGITPDFKVLATKNDVNKKYDSVLEIGLLILENTIATTDN